MGTGYDPGASADSSTSKLKCLDDDYFPPGGDARCNYMSSGDTEWIPNVNPTAVNPQTPMYLTGDDWSWECWVHPRIGVAAYGADPPVWGAWGGGVDGCCCPFTMAAAAHKYWVIFRQGVGMGVAYMGQNIDPYAQVVTPFPTNMDQWFHFVCNINRSIAVPEIRFWLNGRYIGAVGIAIASVIGRIAQPEIRDGTGVNNLGWAPVLGAFAAHLRMMTNAEILASYRSRTVSNFGASMTMGSGTCMAFDLKDTYFQEGVTYDMPPGGAGVTTLLPDANLGNGVLDGVSSTTFYSAATPIVNGQVILERTGNYNPCWAGEGTGYVHRFGWFDGR